MAKRKSGNGKALKILHQDSKKPVKKSYSSKRQKKYNNVLHYDEFGNLIAQSTKELKRYNDLLVMQELGEISDLEPQKIFNFKLNGIKITSYRCDFAYKDANGNEVIEDVKGSMRSLTREFKIKSKMMKAFYNIDVQLYI